ncbi:hypothetical protein [Streptomyces sp. NPDC046261]|uniref:hypothetical protein n=1 Tax=Streptomyces sp. NPDC046261 TaxID=3157200 RepID=UPI0033FF2DF8
MQPPSIPTPAWWTISVFATVAFLMVTVPIMPTTRSRVQVSLAPVLAALFAVASAYAKHYGPETLLPMYTAAMLGIPLGLLGHQRELKQKILDREAHGERPENKPSGAAVAQLVGVLMVMAALAVWITSDTW